MTPMFRASDSSAGVQTTVTNIIELPDRLSQGSACGSRSMSDQEPTVPHKPWLEP